MTFLCTILALIKKLKVISDHRLFYPLIFISVTIAAYYKLFLFGKVPFPGDLLVNSYSPWFSYHKFPIQNPLISDVFSQLFLWKYLAIDTFKAFGWPLWNPYSFMGTPLLANYQSAVLYPFNLLLLFSQNHLGWAIFIFSQTLFAGINIYLLLSCWLSSRLARLFGVVIFSFGGLMTTWVELGTAVHAIAWLPLSFYGVEKFQNTGKVRYLLVLTLSATLITLAGNAQVTTYSYVLIGAFTILRSVSKDFKKLLKIILPLSASLLISILIATPQLLPSYELLQKSIRTDDAYIATSDYGLLPTREVFRFFIADIYGNPVTLNYWGFLNYFETSSFVGTFALVLLLYFLFFSKKNKISVFFMGLLFLSLILLFKNPLSLLIYKSNIPLLTSSFASRILFISVLSIAIVCSFAANHLLNESQDEKNLKKTIVWSLAAVLGILVGFLFSEQAVTYLVKNAPTKYDLQFYLNDTDYSLNGFKVAARNIIPPLLLLGISVALSALISLKVRVWPLKLSPKIRISLIVVFLLVGLTFDLTRYFIKFNPFVSASLVFPSSPSLDFLKQQEGVFRIGREHAEVLPPNTWMAYGLSTYEGYDPLYLKDYARFMHFLNTGRIKNSALGRYAELSNNYSSPYLDAANVKYYIGVLRDKEGRVPGDQIFYQLQQPNFEVVLKDKSSVILKNKAFLERAYFAKNFSVEKENTLENIFENDRNFDPRISVILSKDLKVGSIDGEGTAEITSYLPSSVDIKTKTNQEQILILSDKYDEGWKAYVDGQETPISKANLVFRAIKVPGGEHQIRFTYWPESFDMGLKIAASTLFFILIVSLISIKKSKF